MKIIKRYLLRDETGHYFQSTSGDGIEAYFTTDPSAAYQFSKDQMSDFRRSYSHIKGRVVLLASEIKRNAA